MFHVPLPISEQLSQGVFAPTVVGQVAPFEKLGVFFFAGEVIVQIALDFIHDDPALSVYGFNNVGYSIFLQGALQAESDFAVS